MLIDIMRYDKDQQKELIIGIEKGLDVSWYTDIRFTANQMKEIRIGLEKRLSVWIYATFLYDSLQMEQLRLCLENCLDVSVYGLIIDGKPVFNGFEMQEIRLCQEEGFDISKIAIPGLGYFNMRKIRLFMSKFKNNNMPEDIFKNFIDENINNISCKNNILQFRR